MQRSACLFHLDILVRDQQRSTLSLEPSLSRPAFSVVLRQGLNVSKAELEFTVDPKMGLNSQSSYLASRVLGLQACTTTLG